MAEPTDPSKHTRMKDPSARFTFSFPNLDGRTITEADPKFKNKVVMVNIGGSWCPNCHDEAPFLGELYKKYRAQGLEIVLLSFEEAAQLAKPTRLRAFIKRYGIEYTVLLAGEPAQLNDKVPQADNLNAFPTTFILGRDGRVRAVHAGFASPAAGAFHEQTKKEISEEVQRLLAERMTN
jgi:thiol-disulfide isomerase/thioredoxin